MLISSNVSHPCVGTPLLIYYRTADRGFSKYSTLQFFDALQSVAFMDSIRKMLDLDIYIYGSGRMR